MLTKLEKFTHCVKTLIRSVGSGQRPRMRTSKRLHRAVLGMAFLSAGLIAALPTRAARLPGVIVSSKIDTEGSILGNIIAQVLARNGIPVINRVALGPTPVVRSALLSGDIDIYPEYTGNAAFFFNKPEDPAWKSAETGYQAARTLDERVNKVVWLTPASANNSWGIGLRREFAQSNAIATLSDFGRFVRRGGTVKLATSAEFVNSPPALPAFQAGYDFQLKPEQLLVLPGGDTAVTIRAAVEQTEGVNAAVVYGTDGGIKPAGLVLLADDRGVEPVYLPTPVIRQAALQAHPAIATILEPVFKGLDLETLRGLNARVQVDGEAANDVAQGYLETHKLLP